VSPFSIPSEEVNDETSVSASQAAAVDINGFTAAPIPDLVPRETIHSIADANNVSTPSLAISVEDLPQRLREFRETVIATEMADWAPERSILREGMIETFVTMRLKDSDDWFKRVPQYQRQNTNPIEKQRYLDQICEMVQLTENRNS
jgi:hypothetical protein